MMQSANVRNSDNIAFFCALRLSTSRRVHLQRSMDAIAIVVLEVDISVLCPKERLLLPVALTIQL